MAVFTAGVSGVDISGLTLGSWATLNSRVATDSLYIGDNLHSAGYSVSLAGSGLGGYAGYGPTSGTINHLAATIPGSGSFTIDGTSLSGAAYAAAVQGSSAAALLSASLPDANTVLGSANFDVLPAYGSVNYVDGGAGFDTLVLNFAYGQARAASWNGQVAIYDTLGHQRDQTVNVEYFRFADQSLDPAHLPAFQPLAYVASYADLIAAIGTNESAAFAHYAVAGIVEGRTTSFDGLDYIASYSDLIQVIGPNANAGAQHYISYGHAEGRSTTFDGLEYIASYGDLIQAVGPNADAGAQHYIGYGHAEGRGTTLFDAAQYLANYADLQAAFGADQHAATLHYINYGYAEHRTDHPLA